MTFLQIFKREIVDTTLGLFGLLFLISIPYGIFLVVADYIRIITSHGDTLIYMLFSIPAVSFIFALAAWKNRARNNL